MLRPYRIVVDSSIRHSFIVDANTPEEAESIGQAYANDGEQGEALASSHTIVAVQPCDVGDMGEVSVETLADLPELGGEE